MKLFYARLSKADYSRSTIKLLHDMLYPVFEMAVDDDIIRKNPCKMALRDFGRDPEAREAITNGQQEKLLAFVRDSKCKKAFEMQREYQFMMGIDREYEVDGMKGFIFTSKNGRPLQPGAVNNVLYNIVDAYNKQEAAKAKKEHRKPEMMPRISAHILRHTGCTRMAERGMDVKVLQYIMGHANIAVTMEVYNFTNGA